MINQITSFLYKICRILRDLNAVTRGPAAMGKRLLRKALGRGMGRLMRRI